MTATRKKVCFISLGNGVGHLMRGIAIHKNEIVMIRLINPRRYCPVRPGSNGLR